MVILLCLALAVVLLFAGLIGFTEMRNRKLLYTKDTCSICGKETGIQGNKRLVFKDGCVCEHCLQEVGYSTKDIGSCLFKSDSVQKIKEKLDLKNSVSQAEWEKHLDDETDAAIAEIQGEETKISKSSDDAVHCPKCGSTQISADKKGFGVGKAAVGAYVAGPIGLVAGNIGAKKVRITCLKCGHQWIAGKE